MIHFSPESSFRFALTDADQETALKLLYASTAYDPGTGVLNKNFLFKSVRTEVAYALRHHTDSSLVRFRLDPRLTEAEPARREALILRVAKIAQHTIRAEDTIGRFTNEDFIVVLRGIDIAGAHRLAERLQQAMVSETLPGDTDYPRLIIQAGCSSLRSCEQADPESLIEASSSKLTAARAAASLNIPDFA